MKPFKEIPCIAKLNKYSRTFSPGNPHELMRRAFARSPVRNLYRFKIVRKNEAGETLEERHQVWIHDMATANRVLLNEDGIWVKGGTTTGPFQSIVPLHIIALEDEQHGRARLLAQKALARQLEARLPRIVSHHVQVCVFDLFTTVPIHSVEVGQTITEDSR